MLTKLLIRIHRTKYHSNYFAININLELSGISDVPKCGGDLHIYNVIYNG